MDSKKQIKMLATDGKIEQIAATLTCAVQGNVIFVAQLACENNYFPVKKRGVW